MSFSLELLATVGIRTGVIKLAFAKHLKVPTQLSFLLAFILLLELKSLFGVFEDLFLGSSGCLTVCVLVTVVNRTILIPIILQFFYYGYIRHGFWLEEIKLCCQAHVALGLGFL
jgi:hypothetical protein